MNATTRQSYALAMAMIFLIGSGDGAWAADPVVVKQDSVIENFPEQEIGKTSASVSNGERETVDVPVTSWRDLPFKTVKKQALDYSCGSAALSTLLTYVYGVKTSEGTIFKAMFENGDKDKIRREGFSLLDMSNYLNKNGFKSTGYKANLDSIEQSKAPFVALINDNGYNHFVVVKSVRGPAVLVGDPNKGNVIYRRDHFAKMWNGIALVITNHAKKGRAVFEDSGEWRNARRLAVPGDAEYASMDSSVLQPMQWQVAPVHTDLLGSLNDSTTNLIVQQLAPGTILPATGGVP